MATWCIPHRSSLPGDHRGIALLEVLVALALVTMTMTALLALRIHDLKVQRHTQQLRTALELLNKHLDVTPLQSTFRPGETTGTFPPPYESYRWSQHIRPTPFSSLWEIQARIFWDDHGRPRTLEAITYHYRPNTGGR